MTVFGKLQLSKQPEIHFRWAVISISVMWFQPLNMYTLLTPMLYITHTITIGLPFPACRYLSLHTIFISMVIAKHLGHAPLPAHLDRRVKSILLFLFFSLFSVFSLSSKVSPPNMSTLDLSLQHDLSPPFPTQTVKYGFAIFVFY